MSQDVPPDRPYLITSASVDDALDDETWKTYWKRAPEVDKEMIENWNKDLDTLLIFVRAIFFMRNVELISFNRRLCFQQS